MYILLLGFQYTFHLLIGHFIDLSFRLPPQVNSVLSTWTKRQRKAKNQTRSIDNFFSGSRFKSKVNLQDKVYLD